MIITRRAIIYISLLLISYIVLFAGSSVDAYPGGIQNNSGDCSCHGANPSSSVTSTHSGFPTDYTASQTYLVTISMSTSVSGSNGGFSFTTDKGTLINPGPNVQISGSSATHTNSGARSWSFEWTAPSTGSGTVNLEVATNAVNGDGDPVGDFWSTLSWSINEVTSSSDSDGDGVDDADDAFPNDPNEWADTDGDGVGDNTDAFPNDASETTDSDGDGVGDNSDAFPFDA